MNDGCPSLLRLITCPSFVCVYFSPLIYSCWSCFASTSDKWPAAFSPSFDPCFSIFFLLLLASIFSWKIVPFVVHPPTDDRHSVLVDRHKTEGDCLRAPTSSTSLMPSFSLPFSPFLFFLFSTFLLLSHTLNSRRPKHNFAFFFSYPHSPSLANIVDCRRID